MERICRVVGAVLMGFAVLHGAQMHAASFDCARARSPMERAICSDKDLSAADSAMSAAYRTALGQLPPEGVSKLRIDQLRWLQWLQTACGVPGMDSAATDEPSRRNAEPKPMELAACMREPYTTRTALLKHAVARIDGVLFLTRSMYLLQPNSAEDKTGSPAFPGFGEFEASWPEAQTSDPTWTAWNAGVLRAALRGAASDASHPQDWNASMAAGVDTSETLSLPKVRNGRAHLDMSLETMGHGAAHPNESFTKLTWLLAEQRPLRASDLFQPGTAWERTVARDCWRQLKAGDNGANLYDSVKGPDDKIILEVVTNPENWTVVPEGLSISWPEYSVTPRVYPQDDTIVPWKLLQRYLIAGFKP